MENETHYAEAVIDNGSFGTRTIRFETGRLARQAAGFAVAYLDDDTMVLSATTASKNPKDQLDFFPSRWTSRSGSRPGRSPARSSAVRAVPPRTPSSPAA
ncbi:Polyribonucleotide nucleotidyltransferase [Streptomyces tendae]